MSQKQHSEAESPNSQYDDDDIIEINLSPEEDTYEHPSFPTKDDPQPQGPEVTKPAQLYLLFLNKMWKDFDEANYEIANEKAMWLLCQDNVPHIARAAAHFILSNAPNTAADQLEHAKYALRLYSLVEPHFVKEGEAREYINRALSEAQKNLTQTEERFKKAVEAEEAEAAGQSSEDDKAPDQAQDEGEAFEVFTQNSPSPQILKPLMRPLSPMPVNIKVNSSSTGGTMQLVDSLRLHTRHPNRMRVAGIPFSNPIMGPFVVFAPELEVFKNDINTQIPDNPSPIADVQVTSTIEGSPRRADNTDEQLSLYLSQFPKGAQTLFTHGFRGLCVLYAIPLSVRFQYPDLPHIPVADLYATIFDPELAERKARVEDAGFSATWYLSADWASVILHHYAKKKLGVNLALLVLRRDGKIFWENNQEEWGNSSPVIIENDGEEINAHYQAMRALPQPLSTKSAATMVHSFPNPKETSRASQIDLDQMSVSEHGDGSTTQDLEEPITPSKRKFEDNRGTNQNPATAKKASSFPNRPLPFSPKLKRHSEQRVRSTSPASPTHHLGSPRPSWSKLPPPAPKSHQVRMQNELQQTLVANGDYMNDSLTQAWYGEMIEAHSDRNMAVFHACRHGLREQVRELKREQARKQSEQ